MTVAKAETVSPPHLSSEERDRLSRAAVAATELGLGAIGALVQRELLAWREFGYRFDSAGRGWQIVADVERLSRERHQQAAAEWARGGQYRPAAGP